MSSIALSQTDIELEALRSAKLTNEEILKKMSELTQAEYIEPFSEHLKILRSKYDMTLEVRPLEIEVFSMRDQFNNTQLRKLFEAFGDQGYYSLITDLITLYQTDYNAVVYAQNLEKVFGTEPDYEFTKGLVRILRTSEMEGSGVDALIRYYENKLDRISPYAEIPKYIRDFDIDSSRLPEIPQPEIDATVPKGLAAEIIATQLDSYGLYIEGDEEGDKDVILEQLLQLPDEDYEKFIETIKVDPEEVARIRRNKDIFRVYGPCNPYPDMNFAEMTDENGIPDANLVYGGARMFIDNSREYDYDNDIDQEEWFTGHCLQCSLRIRAYFHAVRQPHLSGGWYGCFCSWKCVRDYLETDFEDEETDEYNKYVLQIAVINEFEKMMDDIGIADRDYEEED